jgi:hypothetical protein
MVGVWARLRRPPLALATLLAAAALSSAVAGPEPAAQAPPGGTLGFAITSLHFAINQTPGATECPDGFNVAQSTNYLKQFPNSTDRAANELKFGYGYGNRGPNGENILFNPEAAKDPVPFKLAVGRIAPGVNLDGTVGPNDFVSPDGRTGIKNQLSRVLGCIDGFRAPGGFFYQIGSNNFRDLPVNRLIVEVSGVDNLQNDPEVLVRTYRGTDQIVMGPGDQPVPGTTQHVDEIRGRRYLSETKGRIVDGVLITDPVDIKLPWVKYERSFLELAYSSDFTIRGMQLRVKLTPRGGEGYIAGYADLATWWNWFQRSWAEGAVVEALLVSPPSLYKSLHDLADGYPDGQGNRTAISMALSANFVSVMVLHGEPAFAGHTAQAAAK